MNNYKITENEINDNNVKSAADLLRGEPRNNKNIFDRLPELIANKFNAFVEFIAERFYSKEEVEEAIDKRVIEIGAGDMAQGVYDKTHNGIVDNAERVNGIWFDFKDENGNPTTEPHMHWLEDDDGKPIVIAPTMAVDLYGDFTVETDGNGKVTIVQEG